MKSLHTPGPWWKEGRDILAACTKPAEPILICEVLDTAEGLEGSDGEAEANARLIAAAPDLWSIIELVMSRAYKTGDGCRRASLYPDDIARIESVVNRLHAEQPLLTQQAVKEELK